MIAKYKSLSENEKDVGTLEDARKGLANARAKLTDEANALNVLRKRTKPAPVPLAPLHELRDKVTAVKKRFEESATTIKSGRDYVGLLGAAETVEARIRE